MLLKKVIYLYPHITFETQYWVYSSSVYVYVGIVYLNLNLITAWQLYIVLFFFVMIDWGFGNLNGSLEQVQVELFEKHICGGSQVNIFQYSMVLFWCSANEGILLTSSSWLGFGMSILCTCDLVLSWFSAEREHYSFSPLEISLAWVIGGIGLVSLG